MVDIDFFNITSAIIVPALTLLVTAIGMRYEIKYRDRELCIEERSHEEQLQNELIAERNDRHEQVLNLISEDLNRLKDEINELKDIVSELSKNHELLKYDVEHISEHMYQTDRQIDHIIDNVNNLRYGGN